jgi:hypothetical protein
MSSGVDRDGQPRGPRRYVMSKRGNDLVRRYLWMAALSALRANPAVKALYQRVVAKHPKRRAVAVGHAMRKLLHLVFAVWHSDTPFDPHHYPWQPADPTPPASDKPVSPAVEPPSAEPTAGPKRTAEPARTGVTAVGSDAAAEAPVVNANTYLDFAHRKRQLPLARVLDHLGLTSRLRGSGPQRRCACPLHRGDGRGRTFSVNLADNVFHCFDRTCGQEGDVLDLWAALHHQSLRDAALDLVRTFDLEPAPAPATEKRHG